MPASLTPWKKSRTFGDIYGGRQSRKFAENIFQRAHSIEPPNSQDQLPILIEENPSRDFFFPLNGEEVLEALRSLPKRDYEGITHIWLRRLKKSDFIDRSQPLAWFACGSGVRVITLYPWPNSMELSFGEKRPSNRIVNETERYGGVIRKRGREWFSEWTLASLRKFYLQGILFHEVGHHIDQYYRHFSAANAKGVEEFADQYALAKTATATHVFNRLAK